MEDPLTATHGLKRNLSRGGSGEDIEGPTDGLSSHERRRTRLRAGDRGNKHVRPEVATHLTSSGIDDSYAHYLAAADHLYSAAARVQCAASEPARAACTTQDGDEAAAAHDIGGHGDTGQPAPSVVRDRRRLRGKQPPRAPNAPLGFAVAQGDGTCSLDTLTTAAPQPRPASPPARRSSAPVGWPPT